MNVLDVTRIRGDDELDKKLLRVMARQAEAYLRSHKWCLRLTKGSFVEGFGGIFALFLFCADIDELGKDVWLWVFIGDVPSAYLEAGQFPSPAGAVQRSLDGIREWICAIRTGAPLDDLIPISDARDEQSLTTLEAKLDAIDQLMLKQLQYQSEKTQ